MKSKEYKLLPNGEYEYKPKRKVMFDKSVEKIFQSTSDKVKKESK